MLSATLVQMAMALAAPWPLKSVLDNVVGNHPAPLWISWLLPVLGGDSKVHIAEAAALLTVAIAAVTGVAMYAGSYLTESLGQSIGNELRVRLYHHLQELSLAYYDTNRVGTLLSTLTGDVQTIQAFASSSTLTILTDTLSLVAMIVVMLWLRWDFALIALAVTPLLAVFVLRVNKAVAPRSKRSAPANPTCWPPCRKACSPSRSSKPSPAKTARNNNYSKPACKPRPPGCRPAKPPRCCPHGHPGHRGMHRPGALARITAGPIRCDDHRVTIDLPGLPGPLFHPVRDLAQMTNTIAGVGRLPTSHRDLRRRHRDPRTSRTTPTRTVSRRDRV